MTANLPPNSTAPRVVLGVCGGVAAYKAIELCRLLTKAGMFVSPILTDTALRFVGAATFAALASEPPRTSLWDSPEPSPHTTLGKSADVIVVAPATARLLAAYAHGLSNDLLSTTLLATRAPVIVAPAMHTEMWENPAVQANVDLLRSRGVVVIDPESGPLAGGDDGPGRLADVAAIFEVIQKTVVSTSNRVFGPHGARPAPLLAGKTVLVTAGGTKEPLDPVRFIGNRSSGKQGYAVAAVAAELGAKVVLISAAELPAPGGVHLVAVATAQEMHDAVLHHLSESDVVIMAAAVADFRPRDVADQKIKKTNGPPQVELVPTADILRAVAAKRRDDQIIVGFAAETTALEANAARKLIDKKLDLIVANDVSAPGVGFGHDSNAVTILDKNGRKSTTGVTHKRTVAIELLNHVSELLDAGPSA